MDASMRLSGARDQAISCRLPLVGGRNDPKAVSCLRRDAAAIHPGSMSYLALGDSYTIGEAVGAAERWPCRLARLLAGRGIQVGEPAIVARTGWSTDELEAAI